MAAGIVAATGCDILAGLGDYTVATTSGATVSGAGGSSASSGGAGGTGGAGAAGGTGECLPATGGGGFEPVAAALVANGVADNSETITVTGQGNFRVDFTVGSGWQLARWFDEGIDAGLDLGGTAAPNPPNVRQEPIVLDPFQIRVDDEWIGAADANMQERLLDVPSTGARFVISSVVHYTEGWDVETTHNVWASGRVGIRATLRNKSLGSATVDDCEFFYTVPAAIPWSAAPPKNTDTTHASWAGCEIPAAMLVVHENSTTLQDDRYPGPPRYWPCAPGSLPPNGTFAVTGQLLLAQTGLDHEDLSARADDILTASIEGTTGTDTAAYDFARGAYDVQVSSSASQVRITIAAGTRYQPAFILHGWPVPTWTISRAHDSVTIASQSEITAQAIAGYLPSNQRLDFVFLEDIPSGATPDERTFVIATD